MRAALIVGDGWESRNVLAAVRGLASAGWRVGVASPARGLGGSSRFARWHPVPGTTGDPARFVRRLAQVIHDGGYEVVFGGGDAEVMALTAFAADLPAVIPYADHDTVRHAFDKARLSAVALASGLAVPRTVVVAPGEAFEFAAPVIVKPGLHWRPGHEAGSGRVEAVRAADGAQARAAIGRIHAAGGEAVVQEVLPGTPTAYVGLLDRDGGVITEWQQDGSGTWPVEAGVWTRARIVALDPELALGCRTLLRNAGWIGLAQLQFIADDRGVPRLIDFNGRFYASGGLPLAAGVNIADLWARSALGLPVASVTPPRVGLRYQWLEGDVLRALQERRGGLVQDLIDTARYRRGAVHSVWRRDDLRPAAALVRHRVRSGSIVRVAGRLLRAVRA